MEPIKASKAAMELAQAMIDDDMGRRMSTIDRFAAFIDYVDRVVRDARDAIGWGMSLDAKEMLSPLMLPDEPDPLVEALCDAGATTSTDWAAELAPRVRDLLTAAGYEIRKVEP